MRKTRYILLSYCLGGIVAVFFSPQLILKTSALGAYGDSAQDIPNLLSWSPAQGHLYGTLINDSGTIYRIGENGRIAFPSVSVFRSHGHRFAEVVPASEGDRGLPEVGVERYADGDLIVDHGTVFITYQGLKYGFPSREVFEGQGYKFDFVFPGDLSNVPFGGVVNNLQQAHIFGSLINIDGALYLGVLGGKILIPSMEVFRSHKFRLERVVPANTGDRGRDVVGTLNFKGGTLANVDGTVYYFSRARTLPFASREVFQNMGFRFENVIPAARLQLESWSKEETLTDILKRMGSADRDRIRLGHIRLLMEFLELYFGLAFEYPTELSDMPKEYEVPFAPAPADGTCSDAQNAYQYTRISDSDYTLTFCLGAATGSFGAGVHTATPAGIL